MRTLLLASLLAFASGSAFPQATAKATFAGGCFWCVEEAFDKVPGVVATTSGYIGGKKDNPTYEQVSTGRTGHTEAVEVVFDAKKVSYEQLLEVFWKNHDPTFLDRQFCDLGDQYRPSIFWHDEAQRKLAEASKARVEKTKKFSRKVVTPIVQATKFWPAEEYHQDYHLKNPARYKFYAVNCGRYSRLADLWGKN
ncbi:MAG: peptide-methionine (S)-S-oxide reductase MsrA [Burkholderiales bacterium]